jgi:hypothetical protein
LSGNICIQIASGLAPKSEKVMPMFRAAGSADFYKENYSIIKFRLVPLLRHFLHFPSTGI